MKNSMRYWMRLVAVVLVCFPMFAHYPQAFAAIVANAGEINVQSYGAKGDGTTNDTAAFQAAFNAALAAKATLVIPPPSGACYRTAAVIPKASVRGIGNPIIKAINGAASAYDFWSLTSAYAGITIQGITLDGNITGAGPGDGTYAGTRCLQVAADNVTLKNCVFQNSFNGAISTYGVNKLIIDGCRVSGTRGIFGDGIYLAGAKDCIVTNTMIEDFTRIGIVTEGYSGGSGATISSARNLISGNRIYNGHDAAGGEFNSGIWCENSDSARILGNDIRTAGTTGIILAPYATKAAPSAPTAVVALSGGSIPDGTYRATVTYVNANGETVASAESTDIVVSGGGGAGRITVTGPNPTISGTVTSIKVYLGLTGATFYAGTYSTGTTLICNTIPTTVPPPTINTTDENSSFVVGNNRIDGCTGGINIGGSSARTFFDIHNNSVYGWSSFGFSAGSGAGGYIHVRGCHFGRVVAQSGSSGAIGMGNAGSTYPVIELKVEGCSHDATTTYATDSADFNIFDANVTNISIDGLIGQWRMVTRNPATTLSVSNSRIKSGSAGTYPIFTSLTTRLANVEVDLGGASMNLNSTAGPMDFKARGCTFTNGIMVNACANTSNYLNFANCTFETAQIQHHAGALELTDCRSKEAFDTNGFVYHGFSNIAYTLKSRNGWYTDASGDPVFKQWNYAPTASTFLSDDTDTTLASGFTPTLNVTYPLSAANGGTATTTGLTALSATNLTSGTVPNDRFPATLPALSGINLTNLPAANVTGANALPDSVLSTNVGKLDTTQTITGVKTFSAVTQIAFPFTRTTGINSSTATSIYSSNTGGGSWPWNASGNMVIETRNSNSAGTVFLVNTLIGATIGQQGIFAGSSTGASAARLQTAAGSTTVPSMIINNAAVTTSPVANAVENDGTNLKYTNSSAARKTIPTLEDAETFTNITATTFASGAATLTGGTMNGMVVGGVTPAAITGTTVTASDNIAATTAGKGLQIKEGSNARMGRSALVAGTVTVSNTSVTANTRIFLTTAVGGGVRGFLEVGTVTPTTSFVINAVDASGILTLATGSVDWVLIEPAP